MAGSVRALTTRCVVGKVGAGSVGLVALVGVTATYVTGAFVTHIVEAAAGSGNWLATKNNADGHCRYQTHYQCQSEQEVSIADLLG